MPHFLLEIGCEEIPARMIDAAGEELARRIKDLLERHYLAGTSPSIFSTPRRLAVLSWTNELQPKVSTKMWGPSERIAFSNGKPTKAAEAFAQRAGIAIEDLKVEENEKGRYLYAESESTAHSALDILAEYLPAELKQLHWPKAMYWQAKDKTFVRPVRWVVALLGNEIVPLEFQGVKAGRSSRGHRILGTDVSFATANSYANVLAGAKVIPTHEEREKQIRKALDAATRTVSGARWREDKSLVETVVNLTEWPSVILGTFDPEFLELPEEVLVTVMRDHQKYFAVEDSKGKLLPHFLAVLNTDGDPEGLIRHGNERVLRARFNDARFFWQSDQKHPLRDRVSWLKNVTFQKDLGSYYEKTLRVQRLCSWLCEEIRENGIQVRPGVVHKAACLAKTDLTTELVKEFTELQGIVGGLYARVQNLDRGMPDATRQLIAQTIYDQYKPESAENSVPRTIEGAVLSIADKAETIAGMFALGLQPTGSKDPFALRRQANGIVRTIAEHKLLIGITQLFQLARETYRDSAPEKKFAREIKYEEEIRAFFRERLEFYLRDHLGYKYDVVNAVLAAGADDIARTVRRAEAVSKMRGSADFVSICVAFKRITNILRQANTGALTTLFPLNEALFTQPEKDLFEHMRPINTAFLRLCGQDQYLEALAELSKLRPYVDQFFDKVLVMAPEEDLKRNRLALLETLKNGFSQVADFSEIVTEGKES